MDNRENEQVKWSVTPESIIQVETELCILDKQLRTKELEEQSVIPAKWQSVGKEIKVGLLDWESCEH